MTDFAQMRSLTARELISALVRDGFHLDQSSGGHHQYRHADRRRVTVSFHGSGETFSPKILRIMIEKQARWDEEDLRRLGILK